MEHDIFRKGSTTYYSASRFFPEPLRSDVFRLYSFVRTADDYVDEHPRRPDKLLELEQSWQAAWPNLHFDIAARVKDTVDERAIKNIVGLAQKYSFDKTWVDAFFAAMKSDIEPKTYSTIDDTLAYTHGSAEVVGLMMARIMGLPDQALAAAALQGRAMQYINFIRDIPEDTALGRQYIPVAELHKYNLPDLSFQSATDNPAAFAKLIRSELNRYRQWQHEANRGFHYIPRRYRIPLRTSVDMYNWTATQIARNPMVIYKRKVKPVKEQVISRALLRMIYA